MNAAYDAIYLSPHLDDVALSCGGQIHALAADDRSVLVLTIMAGDPPDTAFSEFASSLHEQWALVADTVAARRAEDIVACQRLGVDWVHWEIPDCIYRLHPRTQAPLYGSWHDIFGQVDEAEEELVVQLANRFADLRAKDRIVAPLTVGRHIDHQIVRAAAERVFAKKLWYYEDYPYVREPDALAAVLPADQKGWRSRVISITPTDLAARVDAIAAYESQVGTFFNGRSDLEQQVQSYVRRVGGERLWTRSANTSLIS